VDSLHLHLLVSVIPLAGFGFRQLFILSLQGVFPVHAVILRIDR
jgi:hypothetical protein